MFKQILLHIAEAALGSAPKEAMAGGILAIIATILSAALGGWDVTLQVLIYFMFFDYVTGLTAAIKARKVDSDAMFWGGVRKIVVLGVIAMAVSLDKLFGFEDPIIQNAAFYFYIGREGLSIIENLGKLNVLVPDAIKERLEQLKGGNKDADKISK